MHHVEVTPELLGANSINPFSIYNSSSRLTMNFSHMSQRLVLLNADEKRFQTGMDLALGEATFSVKAPCDMLVLYVLDRYPSRGNKDGIPDNPETIIIYEDSSTKSIGCLSVPKYDSYHQYMGFELKHKEAFSEIGYGRHFKKGTIFADSTAKKENGGYAFGRDLNVAYMSLPAVADDGFIVSEETLDMLQFHMYKKCVVEFGNNTFPLNLYGDVNNYKRRNTERSITVPNTSSILLY